MGLGANCSLKLVDIYPTAVASCHLPVASCQ